MTSTMPIPAEVRDRRLKAAGIPIKYRGLTLADWRPYNQVSAAAHAAAHTFLDTFPHRYSTDPIPADRSLIGKGLVLVGQPGAGKTTLAAILAQEVRNRHNVAVFFVPMADYIHQLLEQINLSKQVAAGVPRAVERFWQIEDFKRAVRRRPLVVFDDVSKEHRTSSGFAADEIDRMFRGRFRDGLPSVLSTNLPVEEWGDAYNPSMRSFAAEAYDEVVMGGRDLRRA
ncbi:ATP-binding protein [Streptosporangium sandarakinum]